MKKTIRNLLAIMLCLFTIMTFISCDTGMPNPDDNGNGGSTPSEPAWTDEYHYFDGIGQTGSPFNYMTATQIGGDLKYMMEFRKNSLNTTGGGYTWIYLYQNGDTYMNRGLNNYGATYVIKLKASDTKNKFETIDDNTNRVHHKYVTVDLSIVEVAKRTAEVDNSGYNIYETMNTSDVMEDPILSGYEGKAVIREPENSSNTCQFMAGVSFANDAKLNQGLIGAGDWKNHGEYSPSNAWWE